MKRIVSPLLVLILAIFVGSCAERDMFILEFLNYPNPFNSSSGFTTYHVTTDPSDGEIVSANLKVYSSNGSLLLDTNMNIDPSIANEATFLWQGVDKNGVFLPDSVYYAEVTVNSSSGSTSRSSTKTIIK